MSDHRPFDRIGLARTAAALALVGLIGFGIWVWHRNVVGIMPTTAGIEAAIKSWGDWAVVASIGLMVLHSLVPFPAELVTFANGMLFGPVWGVVVTWVGAMLGAALAFALARGFGRPFVAAFMTEGQVSGLDRWTRRQGIGALLLSRLMPLISFNVINYAAGLSPVSWWTFLWTTGLGILPVTTLLVVTGDQIWRGHGSAWIYLAATAAAGALLWWLIARRAPADR